jgi:hypothetical protein
MENGVGYGPWRNNNITTAMLPKKWVVSNKTNNDVDCGDHSPEL